VTSKLSPTAFEAAVRAAVEAGDHEAATTIVIRELGPELLGWLIERLRDESAASDAFSEFAQDLWQAWPGFAWGCTARGWAYTLARNAANRCTLVARRHAARQVPLSRSPAVAKAVAHVRTTTQPFQRTDVKDRFRALRRHLSEEDQTILVLDLQWVEIAHTLIFQADGAAPPDAAALRREAARLRKRLQIIKERIRELAREAGLV
jgi:RNA polymerase sigma-70 factor (ECF subfamily)